MLNFLGLCQNLSVLAQTSWDSEVLFKDERTGALANLDALTFTGWVIVQGDKREIRCTRSGLYNHLLALTLPKLPEGRWNYEVFASIETGAKCRMIYGSVTAVGGLDSDNGDLYDTRTLELRLPGDAQRRIQAEWKATSAAIMAANEARAVLAEIKKVEVKIDGIDDAVQAANDARDDAISARDEAQDIVNNAPREYIPDISDDGYWVINGVKTTKRAVPRDGVDGADNVTVVRHEINSVDELPTEGDTCNAGHVYYIKTTDGSPMPCYVWVINSEGEGRWGLAHADGMGGANITIGEATAQELGTVRLGSDDVATGQYMAPVKKDAQGRMWVMIDDAIGRATPDSYGWVKIGSFLNSKQDIPFRFSVTIDDAGQMCQNIVPGGALQHRIGWEWEITGTPGIDTKRIHPQDFHLGLRTSDSFTQSEPRGLELRPATLSRIGGVWLTDKLDDSTPAHVIDTATLKAALDMIFYTKTQVDTKLKDYIKTNTTLFAIRILTQEEYDNLPQIDAHTLYLVY